MHDEALARLKFELLTLLLTVSPAEREQLIRELGPEPTIARLREVLTRRGHVAHAQN